MGQGKRKRRIKARWVEIKLLNDPRRIERRDKENKPNDAEAIIHPLPEVDWGPASSRAKGDLPQPPPNFLLPSMMLHGTNYLFGQFGSSALLCPLPTLCAAPICSLGVEGEWETEKALTPCKHGSAAAKTGVWYQHWLGHTSKPQTHKSCCEENPSQPDLVHGHRLFPYLKPSVFK